MADKYTQERKLYRQADAAGRAAAQVVAVTPMIVGSPSTPLGSDIDPSKPVYVVESGVCGFAWVSVKPANSRIAKFLVAEGKARKDSYAGGVRVWVGDYGQSMTRKEAYAFAFAKVLQLANVRAYAESRMD